MPNPMPAMTGKPQYDPAGVEVLDVAMQIRNISSVELPTMVGILNVFVLTIYRAVVAVAIADTTNVRR